MTYLFHGSSPTDFACGSQCLCLRISDASCSSSWQLFGQTNILSIVISEAKDENLNDPRRDGCTRRSSPRKVPRTTVINLVSYSLSIIKGKRPHSFRYVPKEAVLPD